MEKAREFQKNIYFCFIDFAKAFDSVDHSKLENSLRDGNIRPPYLSPVKPVSVLLLLLLLSRFSHARHCETHRWQPTRLPHPWDSPGKNTAVGCHFFLQCMKGKSESEVIKVLGCFLFIYNDLFDNTHSVKGLAFTKSDC